MLTELPELKEEEKMMEAIEKKLNVQLIRLREEEVYLKRLIREENADSQSLSLEIAEEDNTAQESFTSINYHDTKLPQRTDLTSSERLAEKELAVNRLPLSQLGSSLMQDDAFSEEEDEEDEEDESSQNLMELWKSMGQS
ncbi:uncharacterized protein [Antedon mediterranea]|uniref:uncharacterized protein n=1 Tax=Antedon mediterranea TaxID=105859 RepID=UPI003AF9E711